MLRRLIVVLSLLVGSFAALAAPAHALPVKCASDDSTPDGRVFPEPLVSVGFVSFTEFECGVKLLEQTYPSKLQITTVATSRGGHPVYDVLLTDETVTTPKKKLLIVSSIHGNEPGGREGGVRVLEDLVDPQREAAKDYVVQALKRYVVHFVFPNPDGWIAGDATNVGFMATRGNTDGVDLNRNYPVQGWISKANTTLSEPESKGVTALLKKGGWYLGTDNHGQGDDTYGAAGLQIVGQFDFQKSETLARYADAINDAFEQVAVLKQFQAVGDGTGQDIGAYHWGTLYDMLGYSASGSLIDYYNTADGLDGTGYATELTAGQHVNTATFGGLLAQVWVDSIRAINFTMLKQSLIDKRYVFPVGGKVAYVYDPAVVTSADGTGAMTSAAEQQKPYAATRMRFFEHLNRYASQKLTPVRVEDVVSGNVDLDDFDSVVLADNPKPGKAISEQWYGALKTWVKKGGNLVVTDAAAPALTQVGAIRSAEGLIRMDKHYVGFVDFTNRTDPLTTGLRGVASQTYDTVPIGYAFGSADTAPNWTVDTARWVAAGGKSLATNGTGRTAYGEIGLGKGKVRFLGALLPQPTEDYFHPYGLQNYAVTYTGYTLLENMLRYDAPGLGGGSVTLPPLVGDPGPPGAGRGPLASTGGEPLLALAGLTALGVAAGRSRQRRAAAAR